MTDTHPYWLDNTTGIVPIDPSLRGLIDVTFAVHWATYSGFAITFLLGTIAVISWVRHDSQTPFTKWITAAVIMLIISSGLHFSYRWSIDVWMHNHILESATSLVSQLGGTPEVHTYLDIIGTFPDRRVEKYLTLTDYDMNFYAEHLNQCGTSGMVSGRFDHHAPHAPMEMHTTCFNDVNLAALRKGEAPSEAW